MNEIDLYLQCKDPYWTLICDKNLADLQCGCSSSCEALYTPAYMYSNFKKDDIENAAISVLSQVNAFNFCFRRNVRFFDEMKDLFEIAFCISVVKNHKKLQESMKKYLNIYGIDHEKINNIMKPEEFDSKKVYKMFRSILESNSKNVDKVIICFQDAVNEYLQ